MEKSASSANVGTKTDAILKALSDRPEREGFLPVVHERAYYRDFPLWQGEAAPDFRQDLMDLLAGLDEASVETVTRSLDRLRAIRQSEEPAMRLYSAEELLALRQLAERFHSDLLKLAGDCWCYRGAMLPIDHFEPGVFADRLMTSALEHPERLRDRDIIDAGAYIGDSALILSPMTDRRVYAFEPLPRNLALMEETIRMNGLSNVEPCPFALGEETARRLLSVNDSGAASTFFESAAIAYPDAVDVPVVRLDDFVRERGLQVGLIKADVEGSEGPLLRGALETLRTQRPALLISIYHNARDYFGIKPWLESLDLGYRFKIRHPVDGEVMTETVLIAEVP